MPLNWNITTGDILRFPADGLIASANPDLNLSGGVGGALLQKYGLEFQDLLRQARPANRRLLSPGECVVTPGPGTDFRFIAHAVAVDTFYDWTIHGIQNAYQTSIAELQARGCRTLTASCLACGYGRCSAEPFWQAIRPVLLDITTRDIHVQFVSRDIELVEFLQKQAKQGLGG